MKMIMAAWAFLMTTLFFTTTAFAEESYTAEVTDQGKFCARVKMRTTGFNYVHRTKCRTLEEWEKAGYTVTLPAEQAQKEQEENEQPTA